MKKLLLIPALLLIFSFAGRAQTYTLDAGHSSVVFSLKHGISTFYGSFGKCDGKAIIASITGPQKFDFTMAQLEFTVDMASVHSNSEGRDDVIKSSDFLEAKKHQNATFNSTSIKALGEDKYEVTGIMTAHGKSQPLTTVLTVVGPKKGRGGDSIGVDGEFVFDRTKFGIGSPGGGLGNEVTIILGLKLVAS